MRTEPAWDELVHRAEILARRGHRAVLGITGAPGAGKTTLAEALVTALGSRALAVGMDAFHLAEDELHRLGRHDRKGAPDTFDAWGYAALLRRLASADEPVVYAPRFDRSIEESIAGAVAVPREVPLVVTEGNYLLLDEPGWSAIPAVLEECWFVELDDDVRHARLVARHQRYGRGATEARERTFGSDERNAEVIATTRGRADVVVRVL